jgi:hypothetical protein
MRFGLGVPRTAAVGSGLDELYEALVLLEGRCAAPACRRLAAPQLWRGAGKRTVIHVDDFRIYDGGADGVANTTGDNTPFAWEGIFTP